MPIATLNIGTRKSGFVREFTVFDVFVFNVVGYSLGVALTTNPVQIGGFAPHANIYVVLVGGLAVALLNGLVYGWFAGAMPRQGGDYVYIGRTLSPGIGFISNFGFTCSQLYGLSLIVGWSVSQAISPALTTFGVLTGKTEFVAIGERLSTPWAALLYGSSLLLLIFVVSCLGSRALKYFVNAFFVLAVFGTLLMVAVLVESTHEQFIRAFDSLMLARTGTSNAYAHVLATAQTHQLAVGQQWQLRDSLRALPLGFLVFLGFTYSVYVGGEVREPQQSQSRGILAALAFGFVVMLVGMGSYFRVVGQDFNSAVGIPAVVEAVKLPAGNSMTFFAGLLTQSTIANVVMNVGTVLWFLLLPFVMVQVCVRNVFAWAFDGLFPEFVTRLSRGTGTPWRATLLVLLATEAFMIVVFKSGIALVGYVALASVCFLATGVAGVFFPFRRADLFEKAPEGVRRLWLGYPRMSVVSGLTIPAFVWILYAAIKYPAVSGAPEGVEDHRALFIVTAVYALGSVYYLLRKAWLNNQFRSERIDRRVLFEELPPE